jgi:replicative DNA helicase
LSTKVKNLEKAPLFIDDTLYFDLRAKARRLVSQHGIRIIIVDYQLMTAEEMVRAEIENKKSLLFREKKH